ncbi:MAG: protein kinase domain-containing protein [Steroidobacteraceae bacterium]
MTTLDDWPRVKRVLEEALARDGAERQAYVAEACGTDSGLRARVQTLLASTARAAEFLETPAASLLDPPTDREQIGRVIHRDLKPANIKLRPDGTVKVLDFGLAEAFDPGGAPADVGTFAGTAPYMSPEQARRKAVDRRCDIWAFGCVLYEMLTGRRPFDGQDVAEVLARIVEHEPDHDALPAATPTPIRRLLRRCLEKDRRKRLPDIGVARIEIDEALAGPTDVGSSRVRPAWIVAAALAVGAIVGVALYTRTPPTESPPLVRASIPLEDRLDFGFQQLAFAVSPDGTRIVYRTVGGGPLRMRQLHDAQSTAIAGTEDASTPFFSPDAAGSASSSANRSRKYRLPAVPW